MYFAPQTLKPDYGPAVLHHNKYLHSPSTTYHKVFSKAALSSGEKSGFEHTWPELGVSISAYHYNCLKRCVNLLHDGIRLNWKDIHLCGTTTHNFVKCGKHLLYSTLMARLHGMWSSETFLCKKTQKHMADSKTIFSNVLEAHVIQFLF